MSELNRKSQSSKDIEMRKSNISDKESVKADSQSEKDP